jgi:hypothetical protein
VALIEYEPVELLSNPIRCPRCDLEIDLKASDQMRDLGSVDACAVCGCRELFVRKDFPQGAGLIVVVVAGLASLYFFRSNFLLAYGILAGAVLIDMLLYAFTGRVTTCYACRAEYRRCRENPTHEGFDLATSEKY